MLLHDCRPSIRVRASALRLSALDHFRGDHIAFLDIFVAIFFIQNHDVRKRRDNQPLWLSAAGNDPRAVLRASRFALRRCRSAFSACFQRSVCRDIQASVSGIVSREESYAQGVKHPHGARSYTSASFFMGVATTATACKATATIRFPVPLRRRYGDTGKSRPLLTTEFIPRWGKHPRGGLTDWKIREN